MSETKKFKCCICGKEVAEYGNDPYLLLPVFRFLLHAPIFLSRIICHKTKSDTYVFLF